MYYLVFEVVPIGGEKPPGKIFAGVWINQNEGDAARGQAKRFVAEQGLGIVELVEVYPIRRSDYDESPEGLEYFEQALIDDEVMVLFESEGLPDE